MPVWVKASKRNKAYHRRYPLTGLRKLVRKGPESERVRKLALRLMSSWHQRRRDTIEGRYTFVNKLAKKYKINL